MSPLRKRIGDLDRILRAIIVRSVEHRGLAFAVAAAVLICGVWCALHLPMDVTPDISGVQVQVLTPTPGLSPEEAETSVTRMVELEMFGMPGLEQVRSLTRFGISQVSLTFAEKADLYRARQFVTERIAQVQSKLPRGVTPMLAPPSTGLGEIFTYALTGDPSPGPAEEQLRRLRMIQEFVVKPALRSVPGIAEINTSGGYEQQLVVTPDPAKLALYGVDLDDLAAELEKNTAVGGGALIDREHRQVIVRSLSRVQKIADFEALTIKLTWGAESVTLGQVAKVEIGSGVRLGAATYNGEEVVLGIALMQSGANTRQVARAFDDAVRNVQTRLPHGIHLRPLYDRADLVTAVIGTVRTNLLIAAGLVTAVLFLFLGSWRAALIVVAILVLSFALGITGMVVFGISGSLLSLGAIDFGVIVDDSIVMVENVARRFKAAAADEESTLNRRRMIRDACMQVRKPMLTGMVVIMAVYLPVLGLSGIEGRMFRPMAAAILLLLLSSLLLTLLLVPALCAVALGSSASISEPRFLEAMRKGYEKLFAVCRRHRAWLLSIVAVLGALAIWQARRLGADFMPALDEGWLVVEVERDPGLSLAASLPTELACERAVLREVPEVETLFSRIGMSAIATDPQGANQNDLYIRFRPRAEWRKVSGRTIGKPELARLVEAAMRRVSPDQQLALNQPIAVRFDEILEGVRTSVAIKLFGPDFEQLDVLAKDVARVVKATPGAGDVMVEEPGRTDVLEFSVDRQKAAQYMVRASQIDNAISTAIMGREVGRIDEGEQFYPVVVRMPAREGSEASALGAIPLRAAEGSVMLRLSALGAWEKKSRVTAITRENGRRREAIFINVEGGDAAGFVARARKAVHAQVHLPEGYQMEFGGSYRNLESGRVRLQILAAIVLAASLFLIRTVLGNWGQTWLVSLGMIFSAMGGIAGLAIRGLPFTMPAAVGFVTLAGLSVLNGLVLVTCFNELRAAGVAASQAAPESAKLRLRPVLMTALVAAAGFIPMALSQAPGAEIQKPFATVVIFGIASASFLTLVIVPILLEWMGARALVLSSAMNIRDDEKNAAMRTDVG